MLVIGVDPGLSGALCFLSSEAPAFEDMPVVKPGLRSEVSGDLLSQLIFARIQGHDPVAAFVELVSAAPVQGRRQGTQSMFNFGRSFGVLLGVLAALHISTTLVQPREWRQAMRVGQGKDASRVRAMQLYPETACFLARKKDHGRADALLLAHYGLRLTQPLTRAPNVRLPASRDRLFS